jgi:hypothetical protein
MPVIYAPDPWILIYLSSPGRGMFSPTRPCFHEYTPRLQASLHSSCSCRFQPSGGRPTSLYSSARHASSCLALFTSSIPSSGLGMSETSPPSGVTSVRLFGVRLVSWQLKIILFTATNFWMYSQLSMEFSALCICKHLYWISSPESAFGKAPNRVFSELALCCLAPLISIPLRTSWVSRLTSMPIN